MRASIVFTGLLVSVAAACGGSTQGAPSNPTPDAGTSLPPVVDAGEPDTSVTVDSGVDAGPPVDNGAPSDVYPAKHPDAPQIQNFGGPVMAAPTLVPVFFPSDAYQADLQKFTDTIGATDFYKANVEEYGVGAATGLPGITLTEAAPATISDDEIQTWLSAKLTAKEAGFEKPGPNTLYVLFYPASTSISLQGSTSCKEFGGYHSNMTFNGADQAYAVVPRCGDFDGLTGVDSVTGPGSHEILEAVTDPFPQTNPAYASTDDDHQFWTFLLGGGEDGDMCAQFPSAFYKPDGFDFSVQRSWSNKLAAAGHDPCAPNLANEVYFNSAVVLPDTVSLGAGGQSLTTPAVKIPIGKSKTVEVDLFSDAKTSGPWTVKAVDSQALQGGAAELSFAWDRTSGQNGEKLHLTITANKAGQYGASGFWIISTLNGQKNIWLGLVGNK